MYPFVVDSTSVASSIFEASRTSPPCVEIVVAAVLIIWVFERTLNALAVGLITFALKVTLLASIETSPRANLVRNVESRRFTGLETVAITPFKYLQVVPSASPPDETIVKSPVPRTVL